MGGTQIIALIHELCLKAVGTFLHKYYDARQDVFFTFEQFDEPTCG